MAIQEAAYPASSSWLPAAKRQGCAVKAVKQARSLVPGPEVIGGEDAVRVRAAKLAKEFKLRGRDRDLFRRMVAETGKRDRDTDLKIKTTLLFLAITDALAMDDVPQPVRLGRCWVNKRKPIIPRRDLHPDEFDRWLRAKSFKLALNNLRGERTIEEHTRADWEKVAGGPSRMSAVNDPPKRPSPGLKWMLGGRPEKWARPNGSTLPHEKADKLTKAGRLGAELLPSEDDYGAVDRLDIAERGLAAFVQHEQELFGDVEERTEHHAVESAVLLGLMLEVEGDTKLAWFLVAALAAGYGPEMSQVELAQKIGISHAAAKSHIKRLRAKFPQFGAAHRKRPQLSAPVEESFHPPIAMPLDQKRRRRAPI